MAFSKMALKLLVDDFNRKGTRPYGKLLTLSRYTISFDKDYFNRICQAGDWDVEVNVGISDDEGLFLTDKTVFSALGFDHLESMDYSAYEWADIIHDLNDTNIPKELENKYDFIIDGGTIEHIFNLKNVLENVYKMLKVGGTFFFDQPVFQGINKGYHNFSPCLFYEYFLANHYEVMYLLLYCPPRGPLSCRRNTRRPSARQA